LSRYVRHYLQQQAIEENKLPLVSTAAKLFSSMCYANKNSLQASIIVAGWDPVYGNQVYEIPLGGAQVLQPLSIGGSGSSYIYGFCDANWREGMTVAEGKEFVARGKT
jgi:20S proteasome subunit beta 1